MDVRSRTHRRFVVEGFLLTPANMKLYEEHILRVVAFSDTVHVICYKSTLACPVERMTTIYADRKLPAVNLLVHIFF